MATTPAAQPPVVTGFTGGDSCVSRLRVRAQLTVVLTLVGPGKASACTTVSQAVCVWFAVQGLTEWSAVFGQQQPCRGARCAAHLWPDAGMPHLYRVLCIMRCVELTLLHTYVVLSWVATVQMYACELALVAVITTVGTWYGVEYSLFTATRHCCSAVQAAAFLTGFADQLLTGGAFVPCWACVWSLCQRCRACACLLSVVHWTTAAGQMEVADIVVVACHHLGGCSSQYWLASHSNQISTRLLPAHNAKCIQPAVKGSC